jgi:hypothetical protein
MSGDENIKMGDVLIYGQGLQNRYNQIIWFHQNRSVNQENRLGSVLLQYIGLFFPLEKPVVR